MMLTLPAFSTNCSPYAGFKHSNKLEIASLNFKRCVFLSSGACSFSSDESYFYGFI